MTTETMTIHKGLAELKVLEKRICNTIDEAQFCQTNRHSNEKIEGVSIEEYKKRIQASYDKVNDLINRRDAIKRAISHSNAVTEVEIAGVKYTIAVAIEMRNHGIEFKTRLKSKMKKQYGQAMAILEIKNGAELEKKVEDQIVALYGQKENGTDPERIKATRKELMTQYSYDFIDPLKLEEVMNKLEKEINDFISEVDSALSTSNALTTITIEY